jgi:organic hydroperoxide reductase OsmC/OhrA
VAHAFLDRSPLIAITDSFRARPTRPACASGEAEASVAKAHQVGPYSDATRNNIDVRRTVE